MAGNLLGEPESPNCILLCTDVSERFATEYYTSCERICDLESADLHRFDFLISVTYLSSGQFLPLNI